MSGFGNIGNLVQEGEQLEQLTGGQGGQGGLGNLVQEGEKLAGGSSGSGSSGSGSGPNYGELATDAKKLYSDYSQGNQSGQQNYSELGNDAKKLYSDYSGQGGQQQN